MNDATVEETTSFEPQRRKAALVLLVVTLVWGATFIWMKQALNALEVEIETFGTFSVVALLVALRFLIAMVLVLVFFPKARAGLRSSSIWKGGSILGGLMLVGFVSQMVALNDINPSTSAFLTSLYVVMTALLTMVVASAPLDASARSNEPPPTTMNEVSVNFNGSNSKVSFCVKMM